MRTTCLKTMVGRLTSACAARLLPLLLLLALPAAGLAQFNYTTNNGKITITGYYGLGGAVTIPSTINGLPVTRIGSSAFQNNTSLTSVTIPNSVTSIGDYAFWQCTSLSGVTIGNSVTSIGYAAFYQTSLTSVTIPSSVTSIGDHAFGFCTSLTSIVIPNSVTSIGYAAFYQCTGLTSVTIGSSVTSIGDGAFRSCTSLTSVVIPNSVFSIGTSAFVSNSSLTSVTIGNSVTSIGDEAFLYCTKLTSVTIPNSVTSMGYAVFAYCANLSNATIGGGVTRILDSTFYRCPNLTSVTIGSSVTNILGAAFTECTSLTSITIPNSVTSIGDYAFWLCTSLTSVFFQGDAPTAGVGIFYLSYPTIYYLAGTTGWTNPWQDRPTETVVAPYIGNVRAAQRAGTQLVDVYYDLTGSSALTVSVAVSTNGGVSYTLGAGSFSGAVGAGITPGSSKKIIWNAGVDLAAKLFSNVRVRVTAASIKGVSPLFTVDTRVGGIAVSGRVLAAASRAPISGATVTLAGQNTSSSGTGQFNFPSVSLSSGNTLTVSMGGYATYTGTVPAPAGATVATMPDILLPAVPVGSNPAVTKVDPRLKGLFLSGVRFNNDFTASVNWNGVTPGYVRFSVNGTQVADKTGSGPEYVASLNMGSSPFSPSFSTTGNRITVQAIGNGGELSAPFNVYVGILPLPDPIKLVTGQGWPFTTYLNGHMGLDYDFPNPPINKVATFPVIGRFGFEVAANASFDYTVTDGDWEAALGIGAEGKQGKRGRRPTIAGLTRYPKIKLYIGNKEISGKIEAGARGTATFQNGITFDEIFGSGEIETKLELGRVGLLDIVPGLTWAANWVPGVGDMVKGVSVIIYAIPGVNGEITFATKPNFHFDTLELTGKVGLEAAYEPMMSDDFELRVYVGGEPSVTFGIPGDLFKNIRFKAYAGAEFKAWLFKFGPVEYVFVDVSYPAGTPLAMRSADGTRGVAMFRVVSTGGDTVRPVSREYLMAGPEMFVASQAAMKIAQAPTAKANALDAFRSIGRRISTPAGIKDGNGQSKKGPVLNGIGPKIEQVDLPILQNVFPGSAPAMAGHGQDLMLLYVTDNGSPNDLQFTDIRWTRFDGTNWSTPLTIQTNTQAEFAPRVAYDGNGDVIAVWERVTDSNFNQTNLTAMAAQMEIVWSKWSHSSGAWSTPALLTSNGYLDHAPLLCGPMTNGMVLATWTANTSNLLMGTNGTGSQVFWSKWNPSSQSWSSPQILLADLPYRLSQSLSGVSNLAVYVWTRDMDGVLSNANDQQVFYCAWTNGVWSAPTQFTADTNGNRNARVSVGPDGHSYLVWQSETNLVLSRDFSSNSTMVRADSQTAGFADYAMTIGPAGNLALLWQEMSQAGSDAHYCVLDPASATWSKDAQLFNDSPLERSFAPVWDDVGNLTVAYNKVQIIYTNKTVTLEGGGTVTITNVPQPGRVDLFVTKRQLIKDVSLAAGDFTVDAENYLPGAAVTLSATLRNSGDVAVSNAVVAFYDGSPTNGGMLITNVPISGWLEGVTTNMVSVLWVVTEPATNHVLYAVADPAGAITEFDETNNTQSLSIGGTDLSVSLVSQTAETNGAVRVIAQVQNLGAPSATNSVLAIRRAGSTNSPLVTVAVPLLEPGRLAQVALDLPAGTQPEGEQVYTLRADETKVTGDIETNNNTSSFAVNLLIDSDGDGIPDSYEVQYAFLSSTNPADALLDYDGDGLNNLAEYQAGTAPNNSASYLRMKSIAAGGTNGVLVTWGSATNKLYSLQRTASLLLPFTDIGQHILSTPPENSYLDLSATNETQFFYRVRVE